MDYKIYFDKVKHIYVGNVETGTVLRIGKFKKILFILLLWIVIRFYQQKRQSGNDNLIFMQTQMNQQICRVQRDFVLRWLKSRRSIETREKMRGLTLSSHRLTWISVWIYFQNCVWDANEYEFKMNGKIVMKTWSKRKY